MQAWWW